jgi:hypothetical protein
MVGLNFVEAPIAVHDCKHFNGKGSDQRKVQRKRIRLKEVRLHRYICLWWASERKLGKKACDQTKKTLETSREQG